jgi:NAD(P)-dependent dehydrogenase (short-subunit alcohol dehydrogenase family)
MCRAPEDVKAALDKALEAFERLDFAFNNAGVEQPITATSEITKEEWGNRVIRILPRACAGDTPKIDRF